MFLIPIQLFKKLRAKSKLFFGKPSSRSYNHVPDGRGAVIEIELLYFFNFTIGSFNGAAL